MDDQTEREKKEGGGREYWKEQLKLRAIEASHGNFIQE